MESLLSTREPQKKGSPMLAVVLTLLVAGGGFAAYWHLKQPPAPAAAGVSTPAPAKPKDPLLDFLLADEPKPSEKGDSSGGEPSAREPGAAGVPRRPRAVEAHDPDFLAEPGALEGEVANLRRVSARHGLNATLQITVGEPVYRSYYTQLPVALTAQGDFRGVLAWLTDLHHSCPAASVGELKISARRESPTSSPKSLAVEATLWLHAKGTDTSAGTTGDELDIVPRLNLVRIACELAHVAGDTPVRFEGITVGPEPARTRPATAVPRVRGSFTFAASDVEANALVTRLRQAPWWEDNAKRMSRLRTNVLQVDFGTPPVDQLPAPTAAVRKAEVPDPFRIGMVMRLPARPAAPADAGR